MKLLRYSAGSVVLLLIGLIAYGAYLELEVKYWDHRIDKLCAENGGRNVGVRVYERVDAPSAYLAGPSVGLPGQVRVPFDSLRSDAPIVQRMVELDILNETSPRVAKFAVQIFRISDRKVLGEEIQYARAGGGIPMPDPGDSHVCPDMELTSLKTIKLLSAVFKNHPIKD